MSILEERYASEEMRQIWQREMRIAMERRLWIAVMRAQRELGVDIPAGAIADYERAIDRIDLGSIDAREFANHHDVKARIDEFNEIAGHKFIHLGMTSRDLTENIEAIQIRESLSLIRKKSASLLKLLSKKSAEFADLPMVARTHNVPAQVTTLGKRFATWAEELLFAFEHLDQLIERFPLRGIKGATGTNIDLIELLGADFARVDQAIAHEWGFQSTMISAAQIYPRSFDFEVIATLVQLAAAPSNVATNIRLMSGFGLVAEGFAEQQVGSSAMPHKVNPRISERITALTVILKGLLVMASEITGEQWNEGDVSCSAVRRVTLPDSFYAIDAILDSTRFVVEGLRIIESSIAKELSENLPELCSSLILNHAIKSGAQRDAAYDAIKSHARAAREVFEETGEATFSRRICSDHSLSISESQFQEIIGNPLLLSGAAPDQARGLAELINLRINVRFPDSDTQPKIVR